MVFPKWLATVHHDGSPKYVSQPHPALGETVRVRLRVGAGAPVRRAFVRTSSEGEQSLTQMSAGQRAPPVQWFEADLPIRDSATHYRFVLEADDRVWWFTAAGATPYNPLDHTDFRLVAGAPPPPWLKAAVFYEIFPDRFAQGDPALAPRPEDYDAPGYPYRRFEYEGHRPRTYPWGQPPPEDARSPLAFYGGDLPGLAGKLDLLQELGVTALYLNPVFTSPSNHRYDAADHEHVDPRLGGDAALVRLREELTRRDMRYVLALELRHVSYWHPWFQRALADPASPEAGFFAFGPHPEVYRSWLGVPSLPTLDHRSAALRERLWAGPDAVARRWLRPPFSADGWGTTLPERLLGQGELDAGAVGRGLRRAIKETRPDAYFVSRNFTDVTAQLQGDQLDGFSDFGCFTFSLCNWLRGYQEEAHGLDRPIGAPAWETTALDAAWRAGRAAVPWSVAVQQHTQLGSQDLPRIRTVLRGDDALHRLAAVIQFTYPGVPGIYYGDEIGLEDVPVLGQRGCMEWDERRWNGPLRALYRDLAALRRASPALQEGGFQMLLVERDTFAFQREGVAERALVVAHRGARPRPAGRLPVAHGGVVDGTRFVERFSGQVAVVERGALPLPELSRGATLWMAEEPPPPPPKALAAEAPPRTRSTAPRCPVCGRRDGARRERRLTVLDHENRDRWVCLWCGATWWRARR